MGCEIDETSTSRAFPLVKKGLFSKFLSFSVSKIQFPGLSTKRTETPRLVTWLMLFTERIQRLDTSFTSQKLEVSVVFFEK